MTPNKFLWQTKYCFVYDFELDKHIHLFNRTGKNKNLSLFKRINKIQKFVFKVSCFPYVSRCFKPLEQGMIFASFTLEIVIYYMYIISDILLY